MLNEIQLEQPESLSYRYYLSDCELYALLEINCATDSYSQTEINAIKRKAIEVAVALEVGALILDVSSMPNLSAEAMQAISGEVILVASYETDSPADFPVLFIGASDWVATMQKEYSSADKSFFDSRENAVEQAEKDAMTWLSEHFPE